MKIGQWITSSFSNGSGGNNCVQVAVSAGGSIHVRNSRRPNGEQVAFTPDEWAAFLAGVKAGEFDVLAEEVEQEAGPRKWRVQGPPAPEGVNMVLDRDGDCWVRTDTDRWRIEFSEADGVTWDEVVLEYGPLTEVIL